MELSESSMIKYFWFLCMWRQITQTDYSQIVLLIKTDKCSCGQGWRDLDHAAGHLRVWHPADLLDDCVPSDGGCGQGQHHRHQGGRGVGLLRPVQHAVHCQSGEGQEKRTICIFYMFYSRIRNLILEHIISYFFGFSCFHSGLKIL